MTSSAMLAGGTGVAGVKVSSVGPAVIGVVVFPRRSGRGWFAIAATTAGVIGFPGLLVDDVLDDVNHRLGINGAACKRLGINGDGFRGVCMMSLGRTELQVVCGEGRHLLLYCCKVCLVFKKEGLAFGVGLG